MADLAETPAPDLLDRTWNFFASVRVATVLLFVLAAASVAGSLIEQEGQIAAALPPAVYYPQRYGPVLGPLLLRLGLTHAYVSWWYLTLLAMVGTSLLVCSVQRFVPLYRALRHPPVTPAPGFLRQQRFRLTFPAAASAPLLPLPATLARLGYRVTVTGDRLFAEQGRWSRWGPFILHLGLILILLGGLARSIPGWYLEATLWIPDGAAASVPGSDWLVRNEGFTAEFHPDGRPRSFTTAAVVIDGGREVKRHLIRLNQPLQYRGYSVYQSSYDNVPGALAVTVRPTGAGGAAGGAAVITIDLAQPAAGYTAGGRRLELVDYYPDFVLDAAGQPGTRSGDPNNPAFRFRTPGYDKPFWFFPRFPELRLDPDAPVQFELTEVITRPVTGLRVKKDHGLWLIWAGLLVVSLGTILTFYWTHRRLWAMVEGKRVLLAGQTHRDRTGFARQWRALAARLPGAKIEQLGG